MALNITINKVSVAASFAAGATVATAVASGGTAPYVYSLATGGDKFAINSSTGVVTTIAAMDINNIASFSVTATDSTTGTALTITSDVIYPPIQAAIQNRFNKPNTIYKVTKDITLSGGTLTIPAGCTLDFQGGSFSNGTIDGNFCNIKGNYNIFRNNLKIKNIRNINVLWASISPLKGDNSPALQTLLNSIQAPDNDTDINGISLYFNAGVYKFKTTITIPYSYSGMYIGTIAKGNNGATQLVFEGEETGTFFLIKAQGTKIENIRFQGTGNNRSTNTGCTILDFKRNPTPNENIDNYNDTEPDIKFCTFVSAHTCINLTGRQSHIKNNLFSMFLVGINIESLNLTGIGGGAVRSHQIHENQFHASNPSNDFKEVDGCIVNKSEGCWFDIRNNYNDSLNLLYNGYLKQSIISGNYTPTSINNYSFYLKDVYHSVIENNHFIYNNNYVEGGQTYFASTLGMVIDGYCEHSRILNNTFYRCGKSAISCTDNVSSFNDNEIRGNKFFRIGNSSEETPVVIDLRLYKPIFNNVITDNMYTKDDIDGEFILIYSTYSQESNVVRNNYGSDRSVFGSTVNTPTGLVKNTGGVPSPEAGVQYYNRDWDVPLFWDGTIFRNALGYIAGPLKGTTAQRPALTDSSKCIGYIYYDTTINKPIWWTGDKWIDATGTPV